MKQDSTMKHYLRLIVIGIIIIILLQAIYKRTRFYYYRPFFIPFGQRLNEQDLVMVSGETFHLKLMNVNKRVTFRSSDFKVALVLFNGKIYARGVGTAVISAFFDDKRSQCLVHVIALNQETACVEVGEQLALIVRGTSDVAEWVSYNPRIATINSNGILTGKQEGITVVAAKVHGKLLRCKVRVKSQKENINK